MKRLLSQLFVAVTLLPATVAVAAVPWLTDLPTALQQAQTENKLVLVNFTGSDWCGWCIKLRNEVLTKPEFDTYAAQHLVLVEVDFPNKKALPDALKRANDALAQKYRVEGFPTLILMNPGAYRLATFGYEPGGPKNFIAEINKFRVAPVDPSQTAKKIPPAGGVTKPVKASGDRFAELKLKGISGTKDRRLAWINDKTLGAGERAKIRVGETDMIVRCEEVLENSVFVTIDGGKERRQLRMRDGL